MGQSLCKGQKDAVLHQPPQSLRSAVETTNNNGGDLGAVDDQLDISRLPVLLSLEKDITRESSKNVRTKLQNLSSAQAPDVPSQRDEESFPSHRSLNEVTSVPPIETGNVSSQRDESITPEEVAEMDKSNYPIKLGDDIDKSSAQDAPSKRDEESSPSLKSQSKTSLISPIETSKAPSQRDESITPEEVAEMDKSNYPIKLGDDIDKTSEKRLPTTSTAVSSKGSNEGDTEDTREINDGPNEVKQLEISQNPLSTSSSSSEMAMATATPEESSSSSKSRSRGAFASKEISKEEMAELDETNYPVKLDELTLLESSKESNGTTHVVGSVDVDSPAVVLGDNDVGILPEEAAKLDKTNFPVQLNDEEILQKERKIIDPPVPFDEEETTEKISTTDEASDLSPREEVEVEKTSPSATDLDNACAQERTEEPVEILDLSPEELSDTENKDKIGSNEYDEPTASQCSQINEEDQDYIDKMPSKPEKLDALDQTNEPAKLDDDVGDAKIISKLPLSPSRSEERIEDTSFNEDIIVSSPVSRNTDTYNKEISSTNDAKSIDDDVSSTKTNDDTPKTEKFELMDLLETEYMRDDKVDPQVEIDKDATTAIDNPHLLNESPPEDLELVETDKLAALDQEIEEAPDVGEGQDD